MAWQCLQISRSTLSPSLRPHPHPRRLRPSFLRCRLPGDDSPSGDEKPESLFMKELKRRGMTQDGGRRVGEMEMEMEEERGRRSGVAEKEFDQGLLGQRDRSMALNSEGLEGLLPRAKLLLTLGGTFFLAFWPLIVTTITIFAAMYFVGGRVCSGLGRVSVSGFAREVMDFLIRVYSCCCGHAWCETFDGEKVFWVKLRA